MSAGNIPLEACPFCGGTDLRIGDDDSAASWPLRPVECQHCRFKLKCDWDKPWVRWNTRAPDPVREELVGALKECLEAIEMDSSTCRPVACNCYACRAMDRARAALAKAGK